MDDNEIIALYFERSENAIKESRRKYGRLCRAAAMRILGSREDAEETENDTYLRAWNAIPPTRPVSLGAYLAAVCRRLAIDRLRANKSRRRGAGQYTQALEELDDLASNAPDPADLAELKDLLERFLQGLEPGTRALFLQRYWWFMSVKEIARGSGMSESAVKMRLARARNALRQQLEGDETNER